MASSTSNSRYKSYRYDVFLSFSGEDTRKTFIDHLYDALDHQGISTFKDDKRLEIGKRINDELLQSIEDSRVHIIVFSKRYASSSWCLNELLKIMECQKKDEQTAFPVFYDVDPSEVRKQSGSVGKSFAIHKRRKNKAEVKKWRVALHEAANCSGWDLRKIANGHEAKVIKLIVQRVSLELRCIDVNIDENLIGMEKRMQDLDSCLEIGVNDVRMIGIKGMGGAGKTTLARAIFDRISYNYEGKSFVENVREISRSPLYGLKKLQEHVLIDVLKDKSIVVSSVHEGKNLMKKHMCGKKVLVVLDDVDHKDQLEMLAGDLAWFKPGSRIIITTRDEHVLDSHNVKWIHDANLLSEDEALCLLNRHAFQKGIPTQEYERLSREVIQYAAGLPLTIKVLGSDLCGKDDKERRDVLERLKTIPLKETLHILELSFENLEEDYKEIFLDVACFLRGWKKDDAIRVLESCGFYAKNGLRVLEKKSLIITSEKSYGAIVDMHDHLVEMGKNIVRREHADAPNNHSRLWVQEEIERVLASDSANEATRCIAMQITPEIVLEGLRNMKKLKCLIVNNWRPGHSYNSPRVKIDEARQYFPNSLHSIYWSHYPHWCLPKTLEVDNLVALEMPFSEIEQLWEGGKIMKKLKFLCLSYSKLKSLDLELTPNLERLDVESCYLLVKLNVHGDCLKSLVYLNLSNCSGLESFLFIKQLESLEVLRMHKLGLKEFPDYIISGHSHDSLLELDLSDNKQIDLSASIGNLHKLVSLNLFGTSVRSLPIISCSLQNLKNLNLGFTNITELPENLSQLQCLENLRLQAVDVKHLPNSICMLKHLKTIILERCETLEKLPEDVGGLESLKELNLSRCRRIKEIPDSICELKSLKELKLAYCSMLARLPHNMGNLKSLQLLDIRETGITCLPQSISLLKGLELLGHS